MWPRLVIPAITAFWLVMTGLLWRAEFRDGDHIGSRLPPQQVWERILQCPNPSNLEIRRGTNRLGVCRWTASIVREHTEADLAHDDLLGEGAIENIAGYGIDLSGHVVIAGLPSSLRYECHLDLDRGEEWRRLALDLRLGSDRYSLNADAAARSVRVLADDTDGKVERTYGFDELRRPQRILADLAGPLFPNALVALPVPMALPVTTNQIARLAGGLQWEARMSSVRLGHTALRAYRLRARLADRGYVTLFVNAIGEIIRVELPERIVLVNDGINSAAPIP